MNLPKLIGLRFNDNNSLKVQLMSVERVEDSQIHEPQTTLETSEVIHHPSHHTILLLFEI